MQEEMGRSSAGSLGTRCHISGVFVENSGCALPRLYRTASLDWDTTSGQPQVAVRVEVTLNENKGLHVDKGGDGEPTSPAPRQTLAQGPRGSSPAGHAQNSRREEGHDEGPRRAAETSLSATLERAAADASWPRTCQVTGVEGFEGLSQLAKIVGKPCEIKLVTVGRYFVTKRMTCGSTISTPQQTLRKLERSLEEAPTTPVVRK